MNDHPGRSAPGGSDLPSIDARPASRSVGDYLLVAQLGDDALGSVYRALHIADGRFVRLLFTQAELVSREERVRTIQIAGGASGP
jgi:hypothetical protein